MTDKEFVLSIYPNAGSYYTGHHWSVRYLISDNGTAWLC